MLQTGIELRKKLQVMRVFVANPKDDTFNDRQNEQDCAWLWMAIMRLLLSVDTRLLRSV